MGPNYYRPETPTPEYWGEGKCEEMAQEPWVCWWKCLNDPLLEELIERAVACNLDMQVAEAKLLEARGHYKHVRGKLWPRLALNYGMSEYHISGDYPFVVTTDRFPAFEVNFDAHWELDIFGARRRLQAAGAQMQTEEEKRRCVLISLISEVARNYIDLRNLQAQKIITEKMLTVHKEMLELTQLKAEETLISDNDYARGHAKVLEMETKLDHIDEAVKHALNHISLLVSDLPGACQDRLAVPRPIPSVPCTLDVGLPSTLVCRRPDIRQAERWLAHTTAEVGIVFSEFFPKFDLSAHVGYWSQVLKTLFDKTNESDKYHFFIKWPFFEGGSVLAKLATGRAIQRAALYEYGKSVLEAFHEVENRLLTYHKEGKRLRQHMGIVLDRCTLLTGAEALKEQGLVSNFQVSQEKLTVFESELRRIESQASLTTSYVALYKALGGGWEAF